LHFRKRTSGKKNDQSHKFSNNNNNNNNNNQKTKRKTSPGYCAAWMSCTNVKCSFTLTQDATISGSPQVTTAAFSPQIALKLSQVLWICWMFSNWSWISLVALHWSWPQVETPLPPQKKRRPFAPLEVVVDCWCETEIQRFVAPLRFIQLLTMCFIHPQVSLPDFWTINSMDVLPIPSMDVWYIESLHENPYKSSIHVGKYTVRPMDPVGYYNKSSRLGHDDLLEEKYPLNRETHPESPENHTRNRAW